MRSVVNSRRVWLAVALCAMVALGAQADIILIDFGDNQGTPGGNWNNWVPGNNLALVNDQGDASGFNLSAITSVGQGGGWGVTAAPSPFDTASIYNDGLFTSGDTITLRLSNLSASETYSFTLFASRDTTVDRVTTYSITGGGTSTLTTSGSNVGGAGINHNVANTVVFSNVAPDGNNRIDLNIDVDTGGFAYLNAMQIEVIPEPGTLALLLGGVLVLWLKRRHA